MSDTTEPMTDQDPTDEPTEAVERLPTAVDR